MTWSHDPKQLATVLTDAGFDVDTSQAALAGGGGSLTARRDRGAETWVVTIDAAGRLKAVVTRLIEESGSESLDLAGQSLRVVTETTRTVTATGQLAGGSRLEAVLTELEQRLRAASRASTSPEPAPREPESRPWWRRWV